MLHVASVCTTCCMLLDVVAQSLKPVKLFGQQLPTFLLFCDRRSVAQQCWIRLHSSSNIVGATHAHYAWITKTYGLYSSHDALQVPNLLGVVASVCTPLPTRTQHANNVGSCCARLHAALDVVRAKNLPFYMVIQATRRSKRMVSLYTFITQLCSQALHRQR